MRPSPRPPTHRRDSLESFLLTGKSGFRSEKHLLFSSFPLTRRISFLFGNSVIQSICCNSGLTCLDWVLRGCWCMFGEGICEWSARRSIWSQSKSQGWEVGGLTTRMLKPSALAGSQGCPRSSPSVLFMLLKKKRLVLKMCKSSSSDAELPWSRDPGDPLSQSHHLPVLLMPHHRAQNTDGPEAGRFVSSLIKFDTRGQQEGRRN